MLPFSRHARRRHRPALAAPAPQSAPAAVTEPTVAQPDDGADQLTREARMLWSAPGCQPASTSQPAR
ncbi:hypothetical protein [Streptomyces sp. NPDC002640]